MLRSTILCVILLVLKRSIAGSTNASLIEDNVPPGGDSTPRRLQTTTYASPLAESVEDGVSFWGNDIFTVDEACAPQNKKGTFQECAQYCSTTPGAVAFTWHKLSNPGCPNACWCKRGLDAANKNRDDGAVSAFLQVLLASSLAQSVEDGVSYWGNDIFTVDEACAPENTKNTFHECAQHCAAVADAVSFTWHKPSAPPLGCPNACWCKRNIDANTAVLETWKASAVLKESPLAMQIEDGVLYVGKDLTQACDLASQQPTFASCAAYCVKMKGATAVAWNTPSSPSCARGCRCKVNTDALPRSTAQYTISARLKAPKLCKNECPAEKFASSCYVPELCGHVANAACVTAGECTTAYQKCQQEASNIKGCGVGVQEENCCRAVEDACNGNLWYLMTYKNSSAHCDPRWINGGGK